MVNKREKKIAVSDDQTAEFESGSSESPSKPAKRRTTSRQSRSAAPTTRQDNGPDVSVEISGSTPGVHEQPSQSMVDILSHINTRLGLLETSVQESAKQADHSNSDLARRLSDIERRVQKAENKAERLIDGITEHIGSESRLSKECISSLKTLLEIRLDSVEQASQKLYEEIRDKDSGLGALKTQINTTLKQLKISGQTVEELSKWASNFVANKLPELIAERNSKDLSIASEQTGRLADGVTNLNAMVGQLDSKTREHLGVLDRAVTLLDRRLEQSIASLISDHSKRADDQIRSAEIVLDQVQSITRAQAEAEKEVLQHLQVFWQRVEETDSGMRRGIVVNSSLRLMRKKLLRSYIELLSNLKCQVELGDEAVELTLVPYDGLVHRWDRSDGEEVAKRHEMATVFLPGWKLGNHDERPLLGRMVEGDNR